MSLQQIFSSSEIDVIFSPGKSDILLVTFAALDFDASVDAFWGRYFAEKAGFSAVGFVAKRNNWYPERYMTAAVAALAGVLPAFPRRITYGSSMGGYGALKYSNLLGATACAVFGPQYSINPSDGVTSSAYTKYFEDALHTRMAIRSEDVCAQPFLFFDPHESFDAGNAAFVKRVAPHTNLIPMPYTGHECIKAVAGIENSSALLLACLSGDMKYVRSISRKFRSHSSVRRAGVAGALVGRRPALAFAIVEKYASSMDQKLRAIFYDSAAASCLGNEDFAGAEKYCLKALELMPERTSFLRRLGDVYFSSKDFQKALECYNRYLALNPNDPAILNVVAGLYLAQGEIDAAAIAGAKALKLAATNLGVLRRLSEVRVRQGNYADAEALLDRAHSIDPTNIQVILELSEVMSRQSKNDIAIEYVRLAVKKAPQNKIAQLRLSRLESDKVS